MGKSVQIVTRASGEELETSVKTGTAEEIEFIHNGAIFAFLIVSLEGETTIHDIHGYGSKKLSFGEFNKVAFVEKARYWQWYSHAPELVEIIADAIFG